MVASVSIPAVPILATKLYIPHLHLGWFSVLDDYHVVDSRPVYEALTFLSNTCHTH